VDYAHTPDALEKALETVRPLVEGRVITVFGCGGDRDRGKRPEMGEIAGRLSDLVLVTSDNPRTEEPAEIIAQVEAGVRASGLPLLRNGAAVRERRGYGVEPDRRKAIRLAVSAAGREDTVLIAGKGHEDYQILGTERVHFDDREEAALAAGEGSGGRGGEGGES
jgi:UDP-N-acetylmuramoyl-L-alanyl-D-glutamate--2,6-diaminopimelate ligase